MLKHGRRRTHLISVEPAPPLEPYHPLSWGRRERERERERDGDKVACTWVSVCGVLNAHMPNPKLLR